MERAGILCVALARLWWLAEVIGEDENSETAVNCSAGKMYVVTVIVFRKKCLSKLYSSTNLGFCNSVRF